VSADQAKRIDHIAAWVSQNAKNSGLAVGSGSVRLIETWDSRTATLHHFAWDEPQLPTLLVKVHSTPSEAAAQFHSMRELASALEGSSQDTEALMPVALSEDLGAVLMPYIQGRSLSDLLKDGDWASIDFRNELTRFMNVSGKMLGRYHASRAQRAECSWREAWNKLSSRAVSFLSSDARVEKLALGSLVTQSYRDYHPGHIIVTPAKNLALLDPPTRIKCDFVYRDLAQFAYNLFIILIRPRKLSQFRIRIACRELLVRQFLNGYSEGIGRSLTSDDEFFIKGYEAYFLERLLYREMRNASSYPNLACHILPAKARIRHLRQEMRLHLQRT
jgi:hypothetical protein